MLCSLAAVALGAAPQIRIVSPSADTEPCAIGSEAKWRAREPLALFAALGPQEPLCGTSVKWSVAFRRTP